MITPAALQGCWRRDWLKTPGAMDETTRVIWMQAGVVYADVRIPADRPDVGGAAALAELSDASLLALMRAEGFAGDIAVAANVCTWRRAINWHGRPDDPDVGHLSFEDPDTLLEAGVRAPYWERWRREADEPVQAALFDADGLSAWLVTVGRRFVFGAGAPDAPSSAGLIAALRAGRRTPALAAHFTRVHAVGQWEGATGIATLATNPLLEGGPLILRDERGRLGWRAQDFEGRVETVALVPQAAAA